MLKYARRRGPEKGYAGSPANSQASIASRRMAWYALCALGIRRQSLFTPPKP